MALTTNLISYWSLSDLQDAHGPNHLSNNNAATFVTGKVGNAGSFVEASSQKLSCASNSDVSVADEDFTFSFWLYWTGATGRYLIGKASSTGTSNAWEYAIRVQTSSVLRFYVGNGSTNNFVAKSGFSASTWYHVVCWHDSVANTINIKLNDDTVTSTSYSDGSHNSGGAFQIGALITSGYYGGLIDEVGFWKRVLTGAEITELYNGGSGRDYTYISGGGGGGPAPDPLVYYAPQHLGLGLGF